MTKYPHASVSQIQIPNSIWWELERRLLLIYFGKPHHTSQIHEMVIRGLENAGPDSEHLQVLRILLHAPVMRYMRVILMP